MANILITGGSGYLGGTLLDQLKQIPLPPHGTIYALVRSEEQASRVRECYGAEPLQLNLSDQGSLTETLLAKKISVVFFLIDAIKADAQLLLIQALAEVGKQLSVQTHFLHTTGAKLFSSHAGHPTDRVLSDAEKDLYRIQKTSRSPFPPMQQALVTNSQIIEAAEARGVRSYIFIPCIVYGQGTGFGNYTSIQTVAVIQAARDLRRVYKVDSARAVWPVSHVHDTTALYIQILRKLLSNDDIPHNREGYYLASSGTVAWEDIYSSIAEAMAKRGFVDNASVVQADEEALAKMGTALECPAAFVPVQLGGTCTLAADRGKSIGWRPSHPADHILETAGDEVDVVLGYFGSK